MKCLISQKNPERLNEAKMRAMKIYENILHERKIEENRKLEEGLLIKKEEINEINDMNYYKSPVVKEKYDKLFSSYKIIESGNKDSSGFLKNYIKDDTFYYNLKNATFLKEEWILVYDLGRNNQNYQKFLKFLKVLIVLILGLMTYKFYLSNRNKNVSFINKLALLCLYSITLIAFYLNHSHHIRIVSKVLLNKNKSDLLKIILKENYNDPLVLQIEKIFSINSKRKSTFEIFYQDASTLKTNQLFIYKHGQGDFLLLKNICHPKIKQVKIINYI